jgi:hypothetical protein
MLYKMSFFGLCFNRQKSFKIVSKIGLLCKYSFLREREKENYKILILCYNIITNQNDRLKFIFNRHLNDYN